MIEIRQLTKSYETGNPVLNGLSATIPAGEVTVFMGGTGSGKSTLIRCINGLETFEQGEIRVGDISLTAGDRDAGLLQRLRQRVGMVFQQYHLFPHMTVLQNVMAGPVHAQGRSYQDVLPEAMALLERVKMADFAKRTVDKLSGGQQQRTALARALAVKPDAILFDEPTAALDPEMAEEVRQVIDQLAETGQTMVVITHDIYIARNLADTFYFLYRGEIKEGGKPEKVLEQPESEELRRFLRRIGADSTASPTGIIPAPNTNNR
jgi:ABC-type polar amino acid transport system ATPase subunit